MSPKVKVPPGMKVTESSNGDIEVSGTAEPMPHTIAFRLPPSERTIVFGFVETFPERQLGAAFRWLLRHDAVREIMAERIAANTHQAVPK